MMTLLLVSLLLQAASAIKPQQMLSAPRRSSAVPNPSGKLAVFSSTSYSFDTHNSTSIWQLMDLSSGHVEDLAFTGEQVSELVWVGPTDTSVLYLNSTGDAPGGVSLWTADLAEPASAGTHVADLPAPYAGLKAVATPSGEINFMLNCLAYANNGSAYNDKLATKPLSTGRLCDSIFVRHWDAYITQQRSAVFAGVLARKTAQYGNLNSTYAFDGNMRNLLRGIEAPVTRPESPVQPYGGSGDYDLSPNGSQLPKANYSASYLYIVPHDGSHVAQPLNGPNSTAPERAQGGSGAPTWSPDGTMIAYVQQDRVSYEADRSQLYICDVATKEIMPLAENWGFSVGGIEWTLDSTELYITAAYMGSNRLFTVPVNAEPGYMPSNITDITSVSDFHVLPDGDSLVTATATWSSWNVYNAMPKGNATYLFKANERDKELAGLGPQDIGHFWYEGTLGDKQQALIVYPNDFDPHKVYDLVFYVDGGPQAYTGNSWSTRWNLKTWADQGYVVVGPNPTGSISFGQNLTDRVQGRWGSWPYEDLVNAHKYACGNLPYVNCSNAVAAGASYGGYMINWIQGHNFGRAFKALVSHDGLATTYAIYGTDELWSVQRDFYGPIWDNRTAYEAWDPLSHAKNFSTPQLVIHSDLDYRLPVSEGIAMFNALQERGVPSRFLNFPDEDHWVLDPENSLIWHEEVFEWINYWTGKVDQLDDKAITQ